VTCNGAEAGQIVAALKAGTTVTVSCGGRVWSAGFCTKGIGVSADGDVCSCTSTYAVRPCIEYRDWGGANTTTCDAPSQTLTVEIK
jgi:hypothetical protein